MFKDRRYEQDRRRFAEEEAERANAQAYKNATPNQRAVFDLFNGSKIEFDNKTAYLECNFTRGNEAFINVTGFYGDFKMFESTESFKDRVRSIIKKELNNRGYYVSPKIKFYFA